MSIASLRIDIKRKSQTKINKIVNRTNGIFTFGMVSDGHHSFDELYYHRMMLFATICKQNKAISWKSKLHHDGTMYDDYFIVGVVTPEGDFTYHYHISHWNVFDVKEIEKAPEYDGHMSKDVSRLLSIHDKPIESTNNIRLELIESFLRNANPETVKCINLDKIDNVLFITGISGSGKTTVSGFIKNELPEYEIIPLDDIGLYLMNEKILSDVHPIIQSVIRNQPADTYMPVDYGEWEDDKLISYTSYIIPMIIEELESDIDNNYIVDGMSIFLGGQDVIDWSKKSIIILNPPMINAMYDACNRKGLSIDDFESSGFYINNIDKYRRDQEALDDFIEKLTRE